MKKGIQVSRRRRAREENSRGHKSRVGGVGRWKEGFTGRWRRAAGVRGTEGERGELGGAAITGMVEGEEHRWRQETGRPEGGRGGGEDERRGGREGVWQAADAGRDMLYDVCSSHRPSLIN